MERATITIGSEDVNVTKANGSTLIDYPLAAANTVAFGTTSGKEAAGPYLSEIGVVMKYGAPSFAMRNGVLTNLLTGQPVPETPPVELEREYANVGALLNDIAARNYLRQVIVDGTVLPYTQYGSLPPAGFGSDPKTGKLVAMDFLPSPTLPIVDPTVGSSVSPRDTSPVVTESRWPNPGETLRLLVPGALAGVPYVLRLHAPAEASDALGRIVVAEMPGNPTVGRSIEIAVNGVVVVPRDTNLISTIQENFVINNPIYQAADFSAPPNSVIEASMIGSGDGGFFFEVRHK